ncbi:hypothetical protein SMICM304S_06848 [Streptomyces microflavus]
MMFSCRGGRRARLDASCGPPTGATTAFSVRLDETGEKAALVATVGCGGRWPRDLTLDQGGQWLYVANERSGNVSWFAVDAETGVPRHAGSVEVPAASCVVLG